LREWGVDTAMLATVSTNIPAIHLYTKTGFERIDALESPSYQKHIPVA
jgi:ribosomal protein S18 acetylase RimI-like enzyme